MRKLDVFPHIFPKAYFDKMVEVIPNKAAVQALDRRSRCRCSISTRASG